MRLLLTRPEPEIQGSAERLRALGHEVVAHPFITIRFSPQPAALPAFSAIVVTSRNGVRALSGWANNDAWHDKPVLTTGPATAALAIEAGFRNVLSADGDAESLVRLILSRLPREKRLLYPAPRHRACDLGIELPKFGYDVTTVEAYTAEKITEIDPGLSADIRRGGIEGILFYSRRTAEAFRALVSPADFQETPPVFLALSARTAEPLTDLPGERRIAAHPDEAGLFALIPPSDVKSAC